MILHIFPLCDYACLDCFTVDQLKNYTYQFVLGSPPQYAFLNESENINRVIRSKWKSGNVTTYHEMQNSDKLNNSIFICVQ